MFSLILCSLVCLPAQRAVAACPDTSEYGSVNLSLPTLPKRGQYNIWTRLQFAKPKEGRLLVEINDDKCIEVDGMGSVSNQWTWLQSDSGAQKLTYKFDQTEGNRIKLIGATTGVKVDRVILTDSDCVPLDRGDNCQAGSVTLQTDDNQVNTVNGPVAGLIYPSLTIVNKQADIIKTTYYRGSQKIQSNNGASQLDTTLLPNGQNQVSIKLHMRDGSEITETAELQVSNTLSTLSPLWRWARINKEGLKTSALSFAIVVFIVSVLYLVRVLKRHRRLLTFHGF